MGKILGIIGGGQLGMMLTEAAKNMTTDISEIIVLDPTENCPASKIGATQIVADFKNASAIKELANKCDIITYEIESGDSKILKNLENECEINPSPETLEIIQDKLTQKKFLSENNIPVAEFREISSKNELESKINEFGLPVLLKTRTGAYDGRGNFKIDTLDQISEALEIFDGQSLMVEKFVNFKMEVSVIASRSTSGEIKTYPLVENIHKNNILEMTIAPARINEIISKNAEEIAHKTMEVLHGAGVFGIEMFVTNDDEILINEIAPRVHNSGHHTLQSSKTSQFEQHLRAILGLKLGSTELVYPTIMYNILGPKDFIGKFKNPTTDLQNVFLKMYGKLESKPQRKIGHVNVVDKDNLGIEKLLEQVAIISESIKIRTEL
uniref:N5-carboxyaminoimidazole ribonucleotide synthase n=1 Tax=uncultured marine thaumarchaeote AD1000_26_G12 TaxID=1455904 RepID=A0A075FSX8_9ARCH|nr:phosphoribosylaminoimidazole carboxylase, ATPase subunit (purK) [uncultured marine thaumarchaeote AD1000_26_G12]|tara:strand:- start:125 stop:1270 length:1146 start_codon:yes stop_codon:yes gene_type:complete